MTEKEKKQLQSLKERVAYLEGIIFALQKINPPLLVVVQNPTYPIYPFTVTC